MVRYSFAERVSTSREFRIFIVKKSVTADGSLLSLTGGVNSIHPAPEIHEHFMIQKATEHVYIFMHNLDNPETTVTNYVNAMTRTDVITAHH